MKSLTKIFFLCLMAGSLTFITSCTKDDEEVLREDFVATYSADETCGTGEDTYDLAIAISATADDAVIITNIYDYGEIATATVSGDQITIPSQVIDDLTISGSGTLNGDNLVINFDITNGTNSDSCTANCTKK